MYKIAVLISGGGSNLQSIIDSIQCGYLNCSIEYVISDKKDAYGLERAKKNGIPVYTFDREFYGQNISENILELLRNKVDLVILAGFLSILKGDILKHFKNRIINIHPSLIPSFCGKGMYGIKVHEKALEYGVKFTGCTVHLVDEGTDTGAIILQRVVEVKVNDTPQSLQQRVLLEEHKALPEAVKLFSEGNIVTCGRKVEVIA